MAASQSANPRGVSLRLLIVAVAAAALAGYCAGVYRPKAYQAPWQLVIWRKFKSLDDRDRFLGLWGELAKHVKTKEAGALAYEISIADNDPTKMFLLERYISKDYYASVHRTSEPFHTFKAAVKDFEYDQADGQSYIETQLGHFR